MTDYVPWFRSQLQASADSLRWAFSEISPSLRQNLPPEPGYLGTWPPVRHIWHVTEYERCLALPAMKQWLGSPLPPDDAWHDDDDTWAKVQARGFEELISAFDNVRQQEIRLLDQLTTTDWETPRETLWGPKPLAWIVTKTFQHTYEHGDTLLRMGLWWESILAEIARRAADVGS
jgi:hypothetical protein